MRRLLVLCTAAVLMFSAGSAAHAALLSFSFSAPDYTATGIILSGVADPFFAGAFDITSAEGTINGQAIHLAPVPSGANSQNLVSSAGGVFFADNVIYPNGDGTFGGGNGIVDNAGLLLQGADLITLYNIYSNSDGSYSILSGFYMPTNQGYGTLDNFLLSNGGAGGSGGTISVGPVPEPSSLALFGTGVLGTVGLLRRKLKSA